VAVVLRCPKCQGRYRPAGSLETGDLDTRCPHCARQRQKQKRADQAVADLPAGGSSSGIVWLSALIAGSFVVGMICVALIVMGLGRLNQSPSTTPTPKAPATHTAPTTTSPPSHRKPPKPSDGDQPLAPERGNDPDWRDR
jgi:hypothetical protein